MFDVRVGFSLFYFYLTPINFQGKAEALAALRFEMDRNIIVSNSSSIDLSEGFTLWKLVNNFNCSDCPVVTLVGEWKTNILRDDFEQGWWLSSNAVMQNNVVLINESPSRICAIW